MVRFCSTIDSLTRLGMRAFTSVLMAWTVQLLNHAVMNPVHVEHLSRQTGHNDGNFFVRKILRPTEDVEKRCNTLIRQVLARHETMNARLKFFRVLTTVFHHGATPVERARLHQKCFLACVNLTQILLSREPLMKPVGPPNF